MESQVTVRIPEDLKMALDEAAHKMQRKRHPWPEEVPDELVHGAQMRLRTIGLPVYAASLCPTLLRVNQAIC